MATLFELAARFQAANAAEALLLIAIKATLILAIARLLLAAMPRASAATKHLVATAALIAVAAMPLLSAAFPAWHLAVAQKQSGQTALKERMLASDDVGNRTTAASNDRAAIADAGKVTLGSAVSVAKTFVPAEPLTAVERAISVAQSTWKGMIVVIFGIVALLLLSQMLLGMLGVWHVARSAEELKTDDALRELDIACSHLALGKEVRLLRSSRISVPVIWGVFRPVLLLPADVVTWPAERLRVVLMHELAHLKRFDGISLLATRIAVSVFWFHPLAWTLERAGRSECERACDDLVLASGTKPSDYADHLLAIARSMPTFDPFRSVTLAMSRKSQLEGRLLSILQPHVVRRVFSGRNIAIACALAIAVIVPIASMRLTAEPANEKVVENKKLEEKKALEQAQQAKQKNHDESDASVDVVDHIESIEDFLIAKLGKLDKRADRFARTPRNGEEWYERAYDYYRNDRYEEAAAAFRKAADLDYAEAKSLYNAACSYALLGDANRAIPALREALDKGWDDLDKIAEDSDFDPVRSDPRFAALLKTELGDMATRRVRETEERFADLQRSDRGKRDGDDWFEVGLDLLRLRKLDESIAAFQKAIDAGENVGNATYNIACAYSLKNDARNGMAWLDKAVEQGFSNEDKFDNDPDIAFLRTQPGFAALKDRAEELELRGPGRHDWVKYVFDSEDSWAEAATHHRAITQKYPQSGRAWFNYGYASLRGGDEAQAIEAFQKAVQLGHRVGTSSYNVACAYALQGNKDAAFEWLKRAKNAGFDLDDYLYDDDDLRSLRRDERFKALAASVEN